MTTGEGIALGAGALALAFGVYMVAKSEASDSEAELLRLQSQLAAQRQQQAPPRSSTGNEAVDFALGVFNAVGGVDGLFDLVDRVTD
jgi:hypothetical protein